MPFPKTSPEQSQNDDKKELSESEINAIETARIQFYQERIKLLKIQAEYEELIAHIEESKNRAITAQHKTAYLYAQLQDMHKKATKEEGAINGSNTESKN